MEEETYNKISNDLPAFLKKKQFAFSIYDSIEPVGNKNCFWKRRKAYFL